VSVREPENNEKQRSERGIRDGIDGEHPAHAEMRMSPPVEPQHVDDRNVHGSHEQREAGSTRR